MSGPYNDGIGARFAGFFGWWIVAAAFVIYFMSAGLLGTGTVYFKPLSSEFGWHRGELSGAFSLGFLLAGAATPLWGRIADRRGPRAAFLPGVILTGAICLLQSRIWNLTSLYIINVALAVAGAGVSLIPVSVILSNWFVRRRGRAIGIAYMGEGHPDSHAGGGDAGRQCRLAVCVHPLRAGVPRRADAGRAVDQEPAARCRPECRRGGSVTVAVCTAEWGRD
jgi:MFS family permease